MKYKFRVEFLEEANEFLAGLDEKPRSKIFYNIWKARSVNDKELLTKRIIGCSHFGTIQTKQIQSLLPHTDLSKQQTKSRKVTLTKQRG